MKNRIIERLFETEVRGFQVRVWCDEDTCPEAKIVYDRIYGADMDSPDGDRARAFAMNIANDPWVNAVQVQWLDPLIYDYESIVIYNDWP